ncbi:MAG: hypothetical protein RSA97_03990, partial [Oscillospiraceae bacterium]
MLHWNVVEARLHSEFGETTEKHAAMPNARLFFNEITAIAAARLSPEHALRVVVVRLLDNNGLRLNCFGFR